MVLKPFEYTKTEGGMQRDGMICKLLGINGWIRTYLRVNYRENKVTVFF
jgi:hypothetical protein